MNSVNYENKPNYCENLRNNLISKDQLFYVLLIFTNVESRLKNVRMSLK